MIVSTLQVSLLFSFLASYFAEDHNGRHVGPDTAPEKDLLPAIRITQTDTSTRSMHHHTHHHTHHRHDFLLPTPGGANMKQSHDYYDYEDYRWAKITGTPDYGEYSESGDYEHPTELIPFEVMPDDEKHESSHDKHIKSAAVSRSPIISLLAVMTAVFFMWKLI